MFTPDDAGVGCGVKCGRGLPVVLVMALDSRTMRSHVWPEGPVAPCSKAQG